MLQNMRLAVDFAKRDFRERYVGTGLGQLWYVLSPLITIFIYTVIFSDFMKMKLDVVDSSYAYSIYLVPGLLAWTSFSTIITRLNSSILDRAGLIKKISVPVYVFQLSIVITEFLLFCIAISLGIGFLLLVGHPVTWSFLWMVPMMGLMTLFAFGLGAILSLFTPFFKDMKEAVPIVLQLLFWGTPIIYMKSMIYDKYPAIVDFNPLYLFIESLQNIFLFSKGPEFGTLAAGFVTAFILLAAAAWLYKKMIGTIKDIL